MSNFFSSENGSADATKLVRNFLRYGIGQPYRSMNILLGHEDFDFPATPHLLDIPPERPDILHCHNLHGRYFDLRALPGLTRRVPVVITLHDAWLFSGHCAHSLDCDRWKTGCGMCPDITIYPATKRDATAYNWRRKRKILAETKLYVAAPSRWLMQRMEQSIAAPAAVDRRVIANGVDLSIFHPADRQAARREIGIPKGVKMILCNGRSIQSNHFKDYETIRDAISIVSARSQQPESLLFVVLGDAHLTEQSGKAKTKFVAYQNNPEVLARYYQAADVYAHASKADTFPNSILEAFACGLPVVATATGGILEQVEEGVTGFLAQAGDALMMAVYVQKLLEDDRLRERFGRDAAGRARERFSLQEMADRYLEWYEEILDHQKHREESVDKTILL